VALAQPDCGVDPAGCDEIRHRRRGWMAGASTRAWHALLRSVALDSVTKASAFILPLVPEPLSSPIGLSQLVWDGASHTLYARPPAPCSGAPLRARR